MLTEETLFHFLLECPSLEEVRGQIMQDVLDAVHDIRQNFTQLIVDCTVLTHTGDGNRKPERMQRLQNHSGRLVYGLYALRYKMLDLIPKTREKKVQVGKDQEKAQSEKDSLSKNQGGKKPN